jgi:drug/metabolite transporter (DMT)-like permease
MKLSLSRFGFLAGYIVMVGMATGISVSYVLLVMVLSWVFLEETLNWMKISGGLLTITGVALLSWQQK